MAFTSSETPIVSVQLALTVSNFPAATVIDSEPAALQLRLETIWEFNERVPLCTAPMTVTFSAQVVPATKVFGTLYPSAVTEVLVIFTLEVDTLRLAAPESNAARLPFWQFHLTDELVPPPKLVRSFMVKALSLTSASVRVNV